MEIFLPANPQPIKIDTDKSALVVVDMQNAFCSSGGMFDMMGSLDKAKVKKVIEVDKKVIESFRSRGLKIVYLRMGYRPDLADAGGPDSPNYWKERGLSQWHKKPEMRDRILTVGSWNWEIIDELKPLSEDILVNKNRYSGFPNTGLDVILRTQSVKYLLFIGLFTNVCVESNIRDAFFHEYFPILISDGCGNMGPDYLQEATIYNVARVFGWVVSSEDLISALKIVHLNRIEATG
jgi:ureidoacrylate peracid hydrolase